MKLLHVISGMDPKLGGVCQAVRTIIAGLDAEGVHNEVASLDAPGDTFGQADPFVTHSLGPGKGPWSYSAKLIPWLLANLSRFDTIILHGLWLYHGYAVHKALRRFHDEQKTAPKLFIMPHGMLDPYFQRAAGRQMKAWRNQIYWKLIESRVVNSAAGVLFTCETERLLAREPFTPYHPQREVVVGLSVEEPPPYTPAMREAFLTKCPELRNQPYILFLSRIHEKKGVDLLLQAYATTFPTQVVSASQAQVSTYLEEARPVQYQTIPALVVAGPGLETSYGQLMQQNASAFPTAVGISFPGMLTGLAKWGAFYGCEAFILPSHQENFGIAVVEALACGKPVLLSNQVNIWREIEAAGGGIVADDTLAGTKRLLEIWHKMTQPEKQLMGEQARLCYLRYFAVKQASENMHKALC